jgi:hypothetical protein
MKAPVPILQTAILMGICLFGLCACDKNPEGPYQDSTVQKIFTRYWPDYELAVDQCVAHPALWVIGSKRYAYEEPEKQRNYSALDADAMDAFNEVRSTLDKLHLKAVYCDRDAKAPGKPLRSVDFVYWDTNQGHAWTHRIILYTFDDSKSLAEAAASLRHVLVPLGRPHWYLSPQQWIYDAGEKSPLYAPAGG